LDFLLFNALLPTGCPFKSLSFKDLSFKGLPF